MREQAAAEKQLDVLKKTSQYQGVYKTAKTMPWAAQIRTSEEGKGRQIHISYFAQEEEAARAFDRVNIAKLGHAQAETNFPLAVYQADWGQLEALGLEGAVALEREQAAARRGPGARKMPKFKLRAAGKTPGKPKAKSPPKAPAGPSAKTQGVGKPKAKTPPHAQAPDLPAEKPKAKSWAPDRKKAGFWEPFNVWWRARREELGRRPSGDEVAGWWTQHADRTWGAAKPTEQATKKHAKCLRTKDEIVKYFRDYRGGQRKAQAAP